MKKLNEMPVRERGRKVVTSPDRVSAIIQSDYPKTGLFGQLKGGDIIVTVNFVCGKSHSEEFSYERNRKESAKQAASNYLRQLYGWIDDNQ